MFRLQDDFTYLMPVHFGGFKFDAELPLKGRKMSLTVSYETDRAQLENYIPEEFELLTPRNNGRFFPKYRGQLFGRWKLQCDFSRSVGLISRKEGSTGWHVLAGDVGE
jgi:hypothetical protein